MWFLRMENKRRRWSSIRFLWRSVFFSTLVPIYSKKFRRDFHQSWTDHKKAYNEYLSRKPEDCITKESKSRFQRGIWRILVQSDCECYGIRTFLNFNLNAVYMLFALNKYLFAFISCVVLVLFILHQTLIEWTWLFSVCLVGNLISHFGIFLDVSAAYLLVVRERLWLNNRN